AAELGRTKDDGASSDAAGPDAGRALRAHATFRRSVEVRVQGRRHSAAGKHLLIYPRAVGVADSGVSSVCCGPVWTVVPGNGPERRIAVHLRGDITRCLRHRAWRLGFEFEVSIDGGDAFGGADDQLRAQPDALSRRSAHDCEYIEPAKAGGVANRDMAGVH